MQDFQKSGSEEGSRIVLKSDNGGSYFTIHLMLHPKRPRYIYIYIFDGRVSIRVTVVIWEVAPHDSTPRTFWEKG